MSLSNSRHAYIDCYEVFDRAIEDPAGIRVGVRDAAHAENLRSRLHYARTLKRRESETIYEPGDPKHGTTAYDSLVCRIRNINGAFFIYIEHRQTPTDIQSLAEVEENERNEGPDVDGRDTGDDLAASVVSGTGDERGDGEAASADARPVRVPQITRRL